MANFKIGRVQEDILRELTAILPTLKDPRIAPMLSVVRVELAGDMGHCKIYVSSMNGIEEAKASCAGLRSASGYIRRELFSRLGLRKSPELHFVADDSIAYAADISEKLNELGLHGGAPIDLERNAENNAEPDDFDDLI
ncbi:MAG: 30S ribosome-binding factor RbfA [Oscillospiraceae bacterium]|nr:30S ribosome-binding factor RbfA [Oscillospiraceae bacterium]